MTSLILEPVEQAMWSCARTSITVVYSPEHHAVGVGSIRSCSRQLSIVDQGLLVPR
jgi:hypothetical protein